MEFEYMSSQWYCANCGSLVMGIRNREGMAKVKCCRCESLMVSKAMGRRHDRIDVYAPQGQQRITTGV